jgi:hypothetical protein
VTPTGEPPGAPPPPPRRVSGSLRGHGGGEIHRLFSGLFAAKGVLTAGSALAVMAVLPWVTASLRTAVAETGATLPPALAWTLDRPWILYALALEALVSGVCMVVTSRGRWIHLVLSSVSLAGLVLFLGFCLLGIVRSMADRAVGA